MNRLSTLVLRSALLTALAGMAFISPAHAQPCGGWLPGFGWTTPGTTALYAWDPDDPGPRESLLVAGISTGSGGGVIVGGLVAWGLAAWDPQTERWSTMGNGLFGNVYAMATLPTGELVVGGNLRANLGETENRIFKWNGSTWSPIGAGFDAPVQALTVTQNGDLIAGGEFTHVAGISASKVVRWNGISWSAMGDGMNATVNSLAVLSNGEIVAGGEFTSADARPTDHIAAWDGNNWNKIDSGVNGLVSQETVTTVTTILPLADGSFVAGGSFANAGPIAVNGIARWDGQAWSSLEGGMNGAVTALSITDQGELLAGGSFTSAGHVATTNLAYWNGSAWRAQNFGSTSVNRARVLQAKLSNGDHVLKCGVRFDTNTNDADYAVLHEDAIRPLGQFLSRPPQTLVRTHDNRVLATGLRVVGGHVTNGGALWNGNTWEPLGFSLPENIVSRTLATTFDSQGNLYIAGNFFAVLDGTPVHNIGKRSGNSWVDLGNYFDSSNLTALATLPNGDIVVGGSFSRVGGATIRGVARYDGTQWSSMNYDPSRLGVPRQFVVVSPTLVYAATSSNVVRWDGTSWSALGGSFDDTVFSLCTLPNGGLVAGGYFRNIAGRPFNRIAHWNGNEWLPLGDGMSNGEVDAVAALSNGDIVAGGSFSSVSGLQAWGIARWNGTSWSKMSEYGIDNPQNTLTNFPSVSALHIDASGELLASGVFSYAGGMPSYRFARWSQTGVPWITRQPRAAFLADGSTLELSAMLSSDYVNISVRWYRNGEPVVDGPGGASIGGGVVSDASHALISPTNRKPVTLRIANAKPSDSGLYHAVFSNDCGSVVSETTTAVVCAADYDGDMFADMEDYTRFVECFEGLSCPPGKTADFNSDGFVDIFDYNDFVAAFEAGC